MRIDGTFLRQIEAIGAENTARKAKGADKPDKPFGEVLEEAEKRVTFSKHAMKRLDERGIEITENELGKLNSAVGMAEAKGIKESLVLMGGKAFIVNVPSNTVVTVLDGGEVQKQRVFTNLDGAVIL